MKSTGDSLADLCSSPQRDRRNQWRVIQWAFFWGLSFVATTLGTKRDWWPSWVTLAGVIGTALLGVAAVLAYRRFLQETDELRRKIEVEALALAFGVGLVGGLTYWLLTVIGTMPATGFVYVFLVMMLAHPVGVLLGSRRYS